MALTMQFLAEPTAYSPEPTWTTTHQTTNDTFDSYLSNLVWNQIDGRYAAMTA